MSRALIAILFLATVCPSAVPAQDSAFQERIEVEWVLVPAVVRKAAPKRGGRNQGGKRNPGSFVRGLERRDFELEVDGEPVAIESFEARADAPVSLIHLQDLSGSMALDGKLETSRRVLGCLLERSRPGDRLALASFAGGKVFLEVPFTGDGSVIAEAVARWRGYGTTALHDAVAWLPQVTVRDAGVKRAALLITDGTDNASELSAAEARELVRRARLPVYVLGLETGSPFELDPEGAKLYRHADMLNLLAQLTGGRYYSIERDASAVCAAIDQELRSQYVLGFAAGGTGAARYRKLEVTVRGRRVEVLHRQGYTGRLPAREAGPGR